MTGLELLKAPEATAGEIADIISAPCPPTIPAHCDGVSCRECWLTWLTGEPIKEKEPPDKRTAPDEDGLHPNLVAFLRQRKHLLGVLEDVKDDVNHELMMMNALYYPPPEDEEWPEYYYERKQSLWYRNGGEITHNYLKHIKKTVRQEIFEYLEKLPVNMEITVNGRQFILTHAAPAELYETYGRKYECERDFAVWMRFDSFPVLEDCTVIFGHTPTIRFQYDNPMAIWDAKSWIGIDCGCLLPEKGDPWSGALGRLSCLRLDDMQVFYSEEPQYDNLKESEEQHYG